LNQETPYNICFLRHGQSTWNRDNRFIGWTDTPLTEDGVLEARVAGQMLQKSGMKFDEAHTSLLRRSIRTMNIALMELGQEYIPVHKHWRLNERNYGNLVVSAGSVAAPWRDVLCYNVLPCAICSVIGIHANHDRLLLLLIQGKNKKEAVVQYGKDQVKRKSHTSARVCSIAQCSTVHSPNVCVQAYILHSPFNPI
jgi:Histidine phosphatase superfamily (branch 1)